MHDAAEQNSDALAISLQGYITFDGLKFRPSSARNQREQPLADAVQRQYARRVHIAQHTDDRGMLLIQTDNNLWLDRTVLQPSYYRLLDIRNSPARRGDFPSIRNINAPLLVHRLGR